MKKPMRLPVARLVAGIVCALTLCGSARAELVDNPQYQSWAKFKVGTKVSYQSQVAAGGMNMSQTMVETIKEITPAKVVLDVGMKMVMGEMTQDMPPRTQDVAAKVEKGQEFLQANFKGTVKEAGKETIEAGGKKYDCKVYEFSGEQAAEPGRGPAGGGPSTGKIWRNDDVPGGLVKMTVQTNAGGMAADITMTMSSIEAK